MSEPPPSSSHGKARANATPAVTKCDEAPRTSADQALPSEPPTGTSSQDARKGWRSRVGATLDTRVVFRQGLCRGHLCVSSWECWNVQGLQRVRLRLAGERPARLPRALCVGGAVWPFGESV